MNVAEYDASNHISNNLEALDSSKRKKTIFFNLKDLGFDLSCYAVNEPEEDLSIERSEVSFANENLSDNWVTFQLKTRKTKIKTAERNRILLCKSARDNILPSSPGKRRKMMKAEKRERFHSAGLFNMDAHSPDASNFSSENRKMCVAKQNFPFKIFLITDPTNTETNDEWLSSFWLVDGWLSRRELPRKSFSWFTSPNFFRFTTTGLALFKCPLCQCQWIVPHSRLLFRYRLLMDVETQIGHGEVKLSYSKSMCRCCVERPKATPWFPYKTIQKVLRKLLFEIEEKVYGKDMSDQVSRISRRRDKEGNLLFQTMIDVSNHEEWLNIFYQIFKKLASKNIRNNLSRSEDMQKPLKMCTKGEAIYDCSNCQAHWETPADFIEVEYCHNSIKLREKKIYGDIAVRTFGRKCKRCENSAVIPGNFSKTSMINALQLLRSKVKEKLPEDVPSKTKVKSTNQNVAKSFHIPISNHVKWKLKFPQNDALAFSACEQPQLMEEKIGSVTDNGATWENDIDDHLFYTSSFCSQYSEDVLTFIYGYNPLEV